MELGTHDVHVWQVDLDDAAWDAHFRLLSGDEREKAGSFRTRELQDHYRRCRSALRMLLADHAGRPAASLQFQYNRFGKPMLADQPWHFNLSHSGKLALIAVSRHPVGVDLEALDKPGINVDELAEWVCHPNEKAALARLPTAERRMLFYRLWTQKEAYCKALGIGLLRAFPALRMDTLPAQSIAKVVDEHADSTSAFFVYDVPTLAGYAASVCIPSAEARISPFVYSERARL